MKETIIVLIPIFFGFVILHFFIIIYGIAIHPQNLTQIVPAAFSSTTALSHSIGWLAVMGLMLHAYSLGSGTYTGLEAVANNVQNLVEPRVATGKRTMLYMAGSLSFTAGGIILLYLLWQVHPVVGQTLNAVVFHQILGESFSAKIVLFLILVFEGGLLFVAANTGFAGGPNVLANMAADGWLPRRFFHLSSRLVVQNGLMLLGLGALAILFWSKGNVSILVILYSINVFITFTLSLLSISIYWIKHRKDPKWKWHLANSICGFITTFSILCVTVIYKFREGGWISLLITCGIVTIGLAIKKHYKRIERKLRKWDQLLYQPLQSTIANYPQVDPESRTAIILIGRSFSMAMHTLLTVIRLFPHQFKNFIFLDVGVVDVQSFQGEIELKQMKARVNDTLDYFVDFCHQNGLAAEGYSAFGANPMNELKQVAKIAWEKYPDCIFFAGKLIFKHESIVSDFLHDQAALLFQKFLHFKEKELMILPMKV